MTVDFDLTIIGGGVIGLACARALADQYSVLLVERHPLWGSETSSRNSEVIHAGLYYPSGSLKERLCIRGRELLYDYCTQHDIPHRRIGKLIVSPSADNPALDTLYKKGTALGIPLRRLDETGVAQQAPGIRAQAALFSPETGIIDSHEYMQQLARDAEQSGALLMRHTELSAGSPCDQGIALTLNTSDGPFELTTRCVVNAAGLSSHDVAKRLNSTLPLPPLHYCRGHYYSYQGKTPFQHLVYPMPEPGLAGLGIHATLDLGGQVRFGPDTEFLNQQTQNYHIPPSSKARFIDAIQRYFPALDPNALQPAYAGIRPKLSGAGDPTQDFQLKREKIGAHGEILHLLGIESPGLTSSLALAEEVAVRLSKKT